MLCNILTPLLLTKRIFSISNLDLNFEAVADLSPLLEDDLALVLPQPSGVGDDHGGTDAVPDQHVQVLVHLHQDLDNRNNDYPWWQGTLLAHPVRCAVHIIKKIFVFTFFMPILKLIDHGQITSVDTSFYVLDCSVCFHIL